MGNYRVNYAAIEQLNTEVDSLTLSKINPNIGDITREKNQVGAWFEGNMASTSLPALGQLTVALNDFNDALRRLNMQIDNAMNNFRTADANASRMFG